MGRRPVLQCCWRRARATRAPRAPLLPPAEVPWTGGTVTARQVLPHHGISCGVTPCLSLAVGGHATSLVTVVTNGLTYLLGKVASGTAASGTAVPEGGFCSISGEQKTWIRSTLQRPPVTGFSWVFLEAEGFCTFKRAAESG